MLPGGSWKSGRVLEDGDHTSDSDWLPVKEIVEKILNLNAVQYENYV